jgi:hypothetical protein
MPSRSTSLTPPSPLPASPAGAPDRRSRSGRAFEVREDEPTPPAHAKRSERGRPLPEGRPPSHRVTEFVVRDAGRRSAACGGQGAREGANRGFQADDCEGTDRDPDRQQDNEGRQGRSDKGRQGSQTPRSAVVPNHAKGTPDGIGGSGPELLGPRSVVNRERRHFLTWRRSDLRSFAEHSPGRRAMQDPQTLRHLARRCRYLVTRSTAPAVAKQLRLWAVELADAADEVERAAVRQAPDRKSTARVMRRAKAPPRRMGAYWPR